MTIYLLLPAYNEAESLQAMRDGLVTFSAQVAEHGQRLQMVVVDDGSTDGTAAVARSLPNCLVVRHQTNLGLAEALRSLFRTFITESQYGDVAVVMDADNTMDVGRTQLLVDKLQSDNLDVVIASRFAEGGGQTGVPPHRALLSLGASALFRTIVGAPGVRDYTCGFRVYSRRALLKLQTSHERFFDAPGFSASVEILLRLHALGSRMDEAPLHLRYDRKEGASKIKLGRTLREYGGLLWRLRSGRMAWVGDASGTASPAGEVSV